MERRQTAFDCGASGPLGVNAQLCTGQRRADRVAAVVVMEQRILVSAVRVLMHNLLQMV